MVILKPAFAVPKSKAIGFLGVGALQNCIYMLRYPIKNTKIKSRKMKHIMQEKRWQSSRHVRENIWIQVWIGVTILYVDPFVVKDHRMFSSTYALHSRKASQRLPRSLWLCYFNMWITLPTPALFPLYVQPPCDTRIWQHRNYFSPTQSACVSSFFQIFQGPM